MNATDECIDVCNSLLRGELSAIETYDQALDKFTGQIEVSALTNIRADHEASAKRLRQHLVEMGGEPASGSGAWGSFAKSVEGTAKVLGESPALMALREGEEHGIADYRRALDNSDVMEEIKVTIRDYLLPPLSEHVAALERLRKK